MGKIVFLDIDGTILDSNNEIPDSTREAVRLLREKGVYVAIATGRSPHMFKDIREALAIDTYVAFNGQMVVVDGKPIYQYKIPSSVLEKMIERSTLRGHSLAFMAKDRLVVNKENDHRIALAMGSLNIPYPPCIPDFYLGEVISQVLLFSEDGEESVYAEDFPGFRFVRWHPFACDMVVKDGSKATGIKKAIAALGFSIDDTYAFGDGLNDMEMLKTVGTGVAMGNGHPTLKKVADLVTASVDENGLYEGVKKLGLI